MGFLVYEKFLYSLSSLAGPRSVFLFLLMCSCIKLSFLCIFTYKLWHFMHKMPLRTPVLPELNICIYKVLLIFFLLDITRISWSVGSQTNFMVYEFITTGKISSNIHSFPRIFPYCRFLQDLEIFFLHHFLVLIIRSFSPVVINPMKTLSSCW